MDINTHRLHRYLTILSLALITGCASTSVPLRLEQLTKGNQTIARCRTFYSDFEQQVEKAKVHDSQTQAVSHFPYLHVDRFLAIYKPSINKTEQFSAWLELSRQRALQTQHIEWQNLPLQNKTQLLHTTQSLFGPQTDVPNQLLNCSIQLSRLELNNNGLRQFVYQNAVFDSDYKTWQRIAGLYAITALPFSAGIRDWHEQSTQQLQQPYESLNFKGTPIRYQLEETTQDLSNQEIASLITKARDNPLGIPQFTPQQLRALFTHFAPVIEIDTISNDDRPGIPYINTVGQAEINTGKAGVYMLLSYTLFAGKVLPQLNYVFWFPARTCDSILDILCGKLDGLTWRVTVADNGNPLQYDTIHNCGCYHTFFPASQLIKRQPPDSLEEWAFTPINAPSLKTGQHILLTLAAGTHYLLSLNAITNDNQVPRQTIRYTFEGYDTLRSLPFNDKDEDNAHGKGVERHSLFDENGLIAGTERGERFLFWPMGIPSPGAMRQWGHHATAFIGRRFFDDPCLLETYYTPALSMVKIHGKFRGPAMRDSYCRTDNNDDS